MKKVAAVAVVIVALSALGWWCASHFLNASAIFAARAQWPNGLGDTDSVVRHFPATEENGSARALVALAKPLDVSFDDHGNAPRLRPIRAALGDHLRQSVASDSMDVAPPPELVSTWLQQHAADIRAVQRQLVAQVPVWRNDPQDLFDSHLPNLIAHMDLFRILHADALEQHRRGDDALAWEDLHACWNLSQSLLGRPELMSPLVGLAGVRMNNGVAAKLAAPPPSWRKDLESFDARGAFIAAYAYEATRTYRLWQKYPAGEPDENRRHDAVRRIVAPIVAPYIRYETGVTLDVERELAARFAQMSDCDAKPIASPRGGHPIPSLNSAMRRIGRLRAEIEGVSRLLALKADRNAPPRPESQCADGKWETRHDADGSVTLAFTKPIAAEKGVMTVPLRWTLRP